MIFTIIRQRNFRQRRLDGLQKQRAALGRELQLHHQRAVVIVKVREPPLRVLPRLARELFHFLDAAELPHERLDVMRGAVQRDVEQHVFGGRRCNARERPRLRVTQLPGGHGCGNLRQGLDSPGHAHLLARRPEIEPAFPAEPVRTRLRGAIGPAVAAVELGDEDQPAVIGGVEVTCQLGDLRFKLTERKAAVRSACLVARPWRFAWRLPWPHRYCVYVQYRTKTAANLKSISDENTEKCRARRSATRPRPWHGHQTILGMVTRTTGPFPRHRTTRQSRQARLQ